MGTINLSNELLYQFAIESNRMSDITNPAADVVHHEALVELLTSEKITTNTLLTFVTKIEPMSGLRENDKEVVISGTRLPNSTTSNIRLMFLLKKLNSGEGQHPWFTHMNIMELHPFTDGNARVARAMWLWNMVKNFNFDLHTDFSRTFYNQTFERYLGFHLALNGE